MPLFLNNPAHWHLRAQELRLLAQQLEDQEAKASILKMAEEYDRLCIRAAKRINSAVPPVSTSKPINKFNDARVSSHRQWASGKLC
jgi:hypothetical protein